MKVNYSQINNFKLILIFEVFTFFSPVFPMKQELKVPKMTDAQEKEHELKLYKQLYKNFFETEISWKPFFPVAGNYDEVIELPKINPDFFSVSVKEGRVIAKRIDLGSTKFIKNKESEFFKFDLSGWVTYPKDLSDRFGYRYVFGKKDMRDLRFNFIYVDLDKNLPNTESMDIRILNLVKFKKNFVRFEKKDCVNMQKEGLSMLDCIYKIHLQVKWEHISAFIEDFAKFIIENDQCRKYIYTFKFSNKKELYSDVINNESAAVIVVYVCLIPGSKKEKNKIINSLLTPIIERYKNCSKQISLNIAPRFSKKINDLVYISGGDGDDKVKYLLHLMRSKLNTDEEFGYDAGLKFIKEGNLKNNKIFTNDMVFFKDYEIEYKAK